MPTRQVTSTLSERLTQHRRHVITWFRVGGGVRFLLLGALVVGAALLPGMWPGVSEIRAAVLIDVVAETRIDLEVSEAAARLEVNGRLVDNTARGIAYREVTVTVSGAAAHREVVLTDRFGRFYLDLDARSGAYAVRAEYAGEPYLMPADAEVEAEIHPLSPELTLEPPAIHRPGARIVLEPLVTDALGPVRAQRAVASSDCQPDRLPSETDDDGRLSIVVVAPSGRPVGSCSVRVQLEETPHRAGFAGVFRVPVAADPSLELLRSRDELGGRVVADVGGGIPVEGVHVRLLDVTGEGAEEVASAVSDARGEVAFVWPEAVEDARFALSMDVVIEDGTRQEVRTGEVALPGATFRRVAGMAAGFAGSGLTLILLIILVLDWRRARPAAPERQEGSGVGLHRRGSVRPPVVPRVDRSGRMGVVIDADTRAPIAGARLVAEGGEERQTETGERGMFDRMCLDAGSDARSLVRVEAPGYRSWEGALSGEVPVIPLVSNRRDVLESYARALDAVASLRREAWWGKLSVLDACDRGLDEIATLRRVRVGDPVATADLRGVLAELDVAEGRARLLLAFEALALLTDRSLFRPVAVDESVLEAARRLEADVLSGVREEGRAGGGSP